MQDLTDFAVSVQNKALVIKYVFVSYFKKNNFNTKILYIIIKVKN